MNIEASSIHASPVSQPDIPHVSQAAPPLDIRVSHHAGSDRHGDHCLVARASAARTGVDS